MKVCKYCEKPIRPGEKVKKFRSKKRDDCHLKCYKENKSLMIEIGFKTFGPRAEHKFDVPVGVPLPGKGKTINRRKIKQTPHGVCPYCDQVIEKNQPTKKFRLVKDKSCHLKCYQQRPHWYGWQGIIILFALSILTFLIVMTMNYHFHFFPNF